MDPNLTPSEQSSMFDKILQDNMNFHCPLKTIKLGSQDKPWLNEELKKLHRLKSREYIRKGKSKKYKDLLKYKAATIRYLNKNTEALKQTNPGQAYCILKRLGAQPGDCTDSKTFSLPSQVASQGISQMSFLFLCAGYSTIFSSLLFGLNLGRCI